MSLNSYLKLEINNTESGFNYNNKFDINKSIKDLNNEIRTDTFVDELLTNDFFNVGGLISLNDFLNNDLLKKLIKISFIEQKDILFVPIEPDDVKREIMRNKKLIDLL